MSFETILNIVYFILVRVRPLSLSMVYDLHVIWCSLIEFEKDINIERSRIITFLKIIFFNIIQVAMRLVWHA
jgi:hypothetical protein